MKQKLLLFFRQERVLCIAALCALLSMIAVPPSKEYASYFNWQVLGLLWCLMAVVACFRSCNLFEWLAHYLLADSKTDRRLLSVLLVMLPFFISMAVTNDVALLTFVPFTLLILEKADCQQCAIPMIVLQTIAANLGSMATPIGNPQNLYLYSFYGLSPREFIVTLLPLTTLSLLILAAAALPILPADLPELELTPPSAIPGLYFSIYLGLFALCILSVLRFLPWTFVFAVVFASLLILDRKQLAAPDYSLLVTFVCFFIFSGNLGNIPAIHHFLADLLAENTLITSVLASQIISNVPAAVLLSEFTEDWRGLLLGVDIGGLGTPVASLASLISLKFYQRSPDAKLGRYLAFFLTANAIGLIVLITASKFWS